MAESKEELKNPLMKVKEESEKPGLKFSIQKVRIMAIWSHHFLQIDEGKNGNSDRFYFLGIKNHCIW